MADETRAVLLQVAPQAGAHSHTMRGEQRKKGGRRKERKKERKKGKGEKKRRKGFCMA